MPCLAVHDSFICSNARVLGLRRARAVQRMPQSLMRPANGDYDMGSATIGKGS